MYFLRATSSFTSGPISGYMRGSPPGIDTIGAPHSSTAFRHCSTVRCFRRIWPGYWILPQPAQAGLAGKGGARGGDLARARAGEIAGEERLQHQDERVLLAPTQPLREHVARHRPHLRDGYAHWLRPPDFTRLRRRAPASDWSPVGVVESILQSRLAAGAGEPRRSRAPVPPPPP